MGGCCFCFKDWSYAHWKWAISSFRVNRMETVDSQEIGPRKLIKYDFPRVKKHYSHINIKWTWPFLIAQLVKNLPATQETPVQFLSQEDALEDRLPTPAFLGFPCGSTCNAGDLGLTPRLGRSPGEGKGCSIQYSGLENSMDCIVHGAVKSRTRLSDFHFHSQRFYSNSLMNEGTSKMLKLAQRAFKKLGIHRKCEDCWVSFKIDYCLLEP